MGLDGVKFVWDEKNEVTPRDSWEKFQKLTEDQRKQLTRDIVRGSGIESNLRMWFEQYVLERDPEGKLKLSYICKESETLNRFISERG